MNRSNLIKLILILAAVLLVAAVVAAILIFGTQNPAAPTTQPSGSTGQSVDPSGTDTVTDPLPSGDVGVGIWDETDPTDPSVTDPTDPAVSDPTGETEPDPSGDVDVGIWDETDPTESTTQPTTQPTQPVDPPADGLLSWEQYQALSAEQRQAWSLATFPGENGSLDMTAFFAWRDAAKAEYEEQNPIPTIDGNIDLGELMGGN